MKSLRFKQLLKRWKGEYLHAWKTFLPSLVSPFLTSLLIKRAKGYFDLEPNRVLDVIFDVYTRHVEKNAPFFLRLIKASPWMVNVASEQHKMQRDFANLIGFKFRYYHQFIASFFC